MAEPDAGIDEYLGQFGIARSAFALRTASLIVASVIVLAPSDAVSGIADSDAKYRLLTASCQ
jgi:hypothetical protein